MIDDSETGQFTNCYWEYLSSRTTNNPGPRQTRYLHSQQKVSPLRKVLQSGWWSEGGRDSEEIKDVFMQKTEIWKIWNNLLLHFCWKKNKEKLVFSALQHVLLVSDFNQNRFDRFIFQGDILSSRLAPVTAKTHSTNVFLIYHSSNLQSPYFRGVWDRGRS